MIEYHHKVIDMFLEMLNRIRCKVVYSMSMLQATPAPQVVGARAS